MNRALQREGAISRQMLEPAARRGLSGGGGATYNTTINTGSGATEKPLVLRYRETSTQTLSISALSSDELTLKFTDGIDESDDVTDTDPFVWVVATSGPYEVTVSCIGGNDPEIDAIVLVARIDGRDRSVELYANDDGGIVLRDVLDLVAGESVSFEYRGFNTHASTSKSINITSCTIEVREA